MIHIWYTNTTDEETDGSRHVILLTPKNPVLIYPRYCTRMYSVAFWYSSRKLIDLVTSLSGRLLPSRGVPRHVKPQPSIPEASLS